LKKNVESLVGDQIFDRFGLAFLASVGARSQLVWILSDLGEFTEAAIHGTEVVRIAEVANHPFSLNTAYLAVGYLHLKKGAINNSIAVLERSLEICRTWSFHQNIPRVAAALGCAYAAAGRVGEALPLLDLVKARARQPVTLVHLDQGYLLIGKLGEALSLASEALDLSRRHGERSYEALTLYVLGEVALYANPLDVDKAEVHYHEAMALADGLKMRPLVAHCHVGLGKLYRRIDDQQQAKAHLTDGVAMMRKMEMGLWLERAEAELKELQ
jgi:tetratricopeptide (TPR) repeat protein